MQERITALLVHDRPEPMGSLRRALESQCIETQSVRSCHEASQALWGRQPPHLALTDTRLPDGSWEVVVNLAARAPAPVNVIVVSEVVDVAVYRKSSSAEHSISLFLLCRCRTLLMLCGQQSIMCCGAGGPRCQTHRGPRR